MRPEELATVAALVGARGARRGARVQALWGGYGELVRVTLEGGPAPTAIVKHVRPPPGAASASDARKRRSYDVEVAFYRGVAARCDAACRVARLYGARTDGAAWLLVLEDLDAAGFPARRADGDAAALAPCLAWLAAFHARFVGEPVPAGLWPTGTYWHLGTRRDELAAIRDPALRAAAPALDAALASARFQTLVHGDAKEANFCLTPDGRAAAAVDFQYVGGGCGIRDVAYLLHGHAADVVDAGLDRYFTALRGALAGRLPPADIAALEAEWRGLVPVAQRDFRRFLAGWRG